MLAQERNSALLGRSERESVQSFPVFRTLGEPRKNWLEKLLSAFADVRGGEGVVVVVLTMNLAVLLGYYLLETVREAVTLTEGGAQVKTYSAGAQALLLVILVPAYEPFASRVRRLKLISWLTLFLSSS